MSDPTAFRIVLVSAGSTAQAREIARALVERRLAACVHVAGAGCSVYRWQGEIHEEEEALLVIKTSAALFPRLRDAITELHSYEVPEILSLPVDDGLPAYLEWLGESVAD